MAKRSPSSRTAKRPLGHVFISYVHTDVKRVEVLAHCLEALNLDVWWNRRIESGQLWSFEIERKLRSASCVLVAWTKNSVNSLFVRAELRDALSSAQEMELVLGGVSGQRRIVVHDRLGPGHRWRLHYLVS